MITWESKAIIVDVSLVFEQKAAHTSLLIHDFPLLVWVMSFWVLYSTAALADRLSRVLSELINQWMTELVKSWTSAKLFCFFTLLLSPQKFDKEPQYALLKELFIQVCIQEAYMHPDNKFVIVPRSFSLFEVWVGNISSFLQAKKYSLCFPIADIFHSTLSP